MTAPWPLGGSDLLTQARWIVWELEGGKFGLRVGNDARDKGAHTKAGLTWRCYSEEYLRMKPGARCAFAVFDALTLDDIVNVFLEVFAMRTNVWRIAEPRLRLAVLDFAIHAGADDAIPALQRAAGATPDGIFGRMTAAAVDRADADLARARVMDARYQKAGRVVIQDPSQLHWLNGWLIRFGRVLTWRPEVSSC